MPGSIPTTRFAAPALASLPILTAAALKACVVVLLAASASLAAQAPARPSPKVGMVCVDADGRPVAGAEVYLFQHTGGDDGRYVQSVAYRSDEQGKAVGAEAVFMNDRGNYDRWFYARVPGRLVGAARSAQWTNQRVINPEGRIRLFPSRSVEGRVTVPAGFDPRYVVVRVRTLWISTGPDPLDHESFAREASFPGLDTALPAIFECRPDAAGRIRFDDVPVKGSLFVVTSGPKLAEAQWRNDDQVFDKPIHLAIEEGGALSGRVLTPGALPAAGVTVTARLSWSGRRRNVYLTSFRAVTDQDGTFTLAGLPATELTLSVEDLKKRWAFRPREGLLVRPGDDPALTLTLEPGTRVSGRVVDPDGRPVEAAHMSALADTEEGPGLDHASTDAQGRYRLVLPSGRARLYFNALPTGFAYPEPQIIERLNIQPGQAEVTGLDFTLRRRQGVSK